MEEIGKALKAIFDKLSDFFDIFDLSFFVSGVATTLCIISWLSLREIQYVQTIGGTSYIILAILICYVNGLVCFALGRWIRMGLGGWMNSKFGKKQNRFDRFDQSFTKILKAHGLESNQTFKQYLERTESRGVWRLYVRLWAEVRQNPKFSNSLSFLKRYWVMAATYDGLSITMMVVLFLTLESWIGIISTSLISNHVYGLLLVISQVLLFFACSREADRYVTYQVEEIVATIATDLTKENE